MLLNRRFATTNHIYIYIKITWSCCLTSDLSILEVHSWFGNVLITHWILSTDCQNLYWRLQFTQGWYWHMISWDGLHTGQVRILLTLAIESGPGCCTSTRPSVTDYTHPRTCPVWRPSQDVMYQYQPCVNWSLQYRFWQSVDIIQCVIKTLPNQLWTSNMDTVLTLI
jgi:hypothetical protein